MEKITRAVSLLNKPSRGPNTTKSQCTPSAPGRAYRKSLAPCSAITRCEPFRNSPAAPSLCPIPPVVSTQASPIFSRSFVAAISSRTSLLLSNATDGTEPLTSRLKRTAANSRYLHAKATTPQPYHPVRLTVKGWNEKPTVRDLRPLARVVSGTGREGSEDGSDAA